MDQIFDRLERLVKTWINSASESATEYAGKNRSYQPSDDPDLDAAMAELDDFLDAGKTESERREAAEKRAQEEKARWERERARSSSQWRSQSDYSDQRNGGTGGENAGRAAYYEQKTAVDQAYRYLGLQPGVPMAEVKSAYKKLLMKYHPDRNTKSPESLKKATEISARVNAAYQLIEAWEESKKSKQ